MSDFTQAVVKSITENPDKWKLKEHTLDYGHNRAVRLWIASGISYVSIYEPYKIEFSFFDKFSVWDAFKKWKIINKDNLVDEKLRQKKEVMEILA